EILKRALTYRSDKPSYWYVLGQALHNQRKFPEAIEAYQHTSTMTPENAKVLFFLGMALTGDSKFKEAVQTLQQATQIAPDRAELYNELGNAYYGMGQLDTAIHNYQKALKLDPKQIDPLINMGIISYHSMRLTVASQFFEQALKINPEHTIVHNNLGKIHSHLGEQGLALTHYERSMSNHPKPTDLKSNIIQAHIYHDESDPEAILKTAEEFDKICVHHPTCTHNNKTNPSRRLRVGYLSPNFSHHAVGQFIRPVLKAHNHDMFEIFGYSNTQQPDNVTEDIETLCDHWHSTNTMKDDELARKINQDGIDILVDLACHSPNSRLAALAYKPAPIQISWLGFNATSGLGEIDYALTDTVACPDEEEHYLTETPLRLPKGVFCYLPFKGNDEPAIIDTSRKNKDIIFGSFNKLAKVNPTTLQLWSEVLKSVPNSRILFKSKLLNSASTRQLFLDRCNSHGIPAERVEVLPFDNNPDSYMNDYQKIDIHLDTTPCNGGITICDSLWMGVPMVTLSSPGITARLSASILTQLGLKKWIAQTPEQFVKIAKSLASSRKKLDKQRTDLRARIKSSPLYDAKGYAEQLETAYRQVWQEWCANL
ncbi:MAG: tetratricopeptide repeat protein, partial [Candidatus Brocadiaceae bacterium]|nr:tetratricopeptide repeat protein [Candidatus Brocadiaceae bacterium]